MELHLQHRSLKECLGLISCKIDWFVLLAVQGTFKILLQHHSSKASIIQGSAFFMVQLSHPCMTTGKAMALTRWTFLSKPTSLLFNRESNSTPVSKAHLLFISSSAASLSSYKQTSIVLAYPILNGMVMSSRLTPSISSLGPISLVYSLPKY